MPAAIDTQVKKQVIKQWLWGKLKKKVTNVMLVILGALIPLLLLVEILLPQEFN